MARVWVFQKAEDVAKLGESKASWYVGWYEPDRRRRKKSFGPGLLGQKRAEKEKHLLEEKLLSGDYRGDSRKSWSDFCQEYQTKVLAGQAPTTRQAHLAAQAQLP
jgi:hypothetical protein